MKRYQEVEGGSLTHPSPALWTGFMRWIDAGSLLRSLSWVLILVLGLLVVYPAIRMLMSSGVGRQTLEFLGRPETLAILGATLRLSVAATVTSVLVGTGLAYLTVRTDMPLRGLVKNAILLSYLTPPLFVAFAYVVLLSPNQGLLNQIFRVITQSEGGFDVFTAQGFVLVATLELAPVVFLVVGNTLSRLHGELEQVARVSGESWLGTMRRVTLPLALPGIAAAALLTFVHATALYGIPAVLGVRLVSVAIQGSFSYPFRYDRAAGLTAILLLIAALATVAYVFMVRRQRTFATVGGRWSPPETFRLGPLKYLCAAVSLLYVGLALLGPYIVLFVTALSRNWVLGPTLENLTFANLLAAVGDDFNRRAIMNSLLFSLAAATLGLAIGGGVAAVIVRGRSRSVQRGLDLLVTAAWAFPAIGLGAAYLITSLQPPVLYGTSAIIILAYTTKFMPLAVRSIAAGLQQLGPEVEEAARIAGAGSLVTTWRILIPLLSGWLLSAWVMMFAPSIHELSSSVLLAGPGTETFALAALLAFESSKFEVGAALGVIGVLMTGVIWAVIIRVGRRVPGSLLS